MKKSALTFLAVTAFTLGILAPVHRALAQDADVDPINDAAGVLVPSSSEGKSGTLYTTASEQNEVLSALRAIPVGTNQYQTSITGVPVNFTLVPVVFPGLYFPPGELICQTSLVKVYRNATCRTTFFGFGQPCQPYLGNWATFNSNPVRQCKQGVGFCVEVKQVVWTRNIYFDNQCTQLLGVQTGTDFRCN